MFSFFKNYHGTLKYILQITGTMIYHNWEQSHSIIIRTLLKMELYNSDVNILQCFGTLHKIMWMENLMFLPPSLESNAS
jgi:hypothetical protein